MCDHYTRNSVLRYIRIWDEINIPNLRKINRSTMHINSRQVSIKRKVGFTRQISTHEFNRLPSLTAVAAVDQSTTERPYIYIYMGAREEGENTAAYACYPCIPLSYLSPYTMLNGVPRLLVDW